MANAASEIYSKAARGSGWFVVCFCSLLCFVVVVSAVGCGRWCFVCFLVVTALLLLVFIVVASVRCACMG